MYGVYILVCMGMVGYFMNDVLFRVYAYLELIIYSRLLLYSSKYLFIFCIVDIKC